MAEVSTMYSDPKILISEDHAISMLLARTICKMILPKAVILEAINGKEAVSCCKENRPDLILMDVNMPEMDGCDATKEIRKQEGDSHVPIIGLSAGLLNAERDMCIKSGMDDYLCKPVLKESLAAHIYEMAANLSAAGFVIF